MSNNSLIKCAQISVDCVANDPVDIRCGGPKFLGFDFNVREEQAQEMQEFISATLANFAVPLTSMYVSGIIDLNEDDLWTEDRIVESIKNDAEYLREEAERNYGAPSSAR